MPAAPGFAPAAGPGFAPVAGPGLAPVASAGYPPSAGPAGTANGVAGWDTRDLPPLARNLAIAAIIVGCATWAARMAILFAIALANDAGLLLLTGVASIVGALAAAGLGLAAFRTSSGRGRLPRIALGLGLAAVVMTIVRLLTYLAPTYTG